MRMKSKFCFQTGHLVKLKGKLTPILSWSDLVHPPKSQKKESESFFAVLSYPTAEVYTQQLQPLVDVLFW